MKIDVENFKMHATFISLSLNENEVKYPFIKKNSLKKFIHYVSRKHVITKVPILSNKYLLTKTLL